MKSSNFCTFLPPKWMHYFDYFYLWVLPEICEFCTCTFLLVRPNLNWTEIWALDTCPLHWEMATVGLHFGSCISSLNQIVRVIPIFSLNDVILKTKTIEIQWLKSKQSFKMGPISSENPVVKEHRTFQYQFYIRFHQLFPTFTILLPKRN